MLRMSYLIQDSHGELNLVISTLLSLVLVGSSDFHSIQLVHQQLAVLCSRLALTPCAVSFLNKLTRHVPMVASGEVWTNTQTPWALGFKVAPDHFIYWPRRASPGSRSGETDLTSWWSCCKVTLQTACIPGVEYWTHICNHSTTLSEGVSWLDCKRAPVGIESERFFEMG